MTVARFNGYGAVKYGHDRYRYWYETELDRPWEGRETLLVVYPDADHRVGRPIYQQDLLERFLDWFDKYVKRSQPANQKE